MTGSSQRRAAAWLAALVGTALPLAAHAAPLTCTIFRDRLEGALVATAVADQNAEIPPFQSARETEDGGKLFNWATSDLTGTLSCGRNDAFQEFYVNREVVPRQQFVEQIRHLIAIDGAAICTVTSASPSGCLDVSKQVLQIAVQQMGVGLNRHIQNPNGISRVMLRDDLSAELTAAPTLITFSLATKEGSTVDAARKPLAPAPATPTP